MKKRKNKQQATEKMLGCAERIPDTSRANAVPENPIFAYSHIKNPTNPTGALPLKENGNHTDNNTQT